MNTKTLTVLGLATVAVLTVAVVSSRRDTSAGTAAAVHGPLFPGLLARVNDVTALEVAGPDGAVRIERQADKSWGLATKSGYPARIEDVKSVLVALGQLELLEEKSKRPERHAELGLQDPGGESRSTRVTLHSAGDLVLADLIVGEALYNLGDPALYVRKAGEDQAWLVSGQVTANSRATSWVEKLILEIATPRMASARIVHPDGEVLALSRSGKDATAWVVEGLPTDRALTSPSAPNPVGNAVTYVSLDDVAPAGTIDFTDALRAEYRTFDGLVIEVQLVEKDGLFWTAYHARFEPPPAPAPTEVDAVAAPDAEGAAPADAELGDALPSLDELAGDPHDAVEEPAIDVAAEVLALNARLSPWVFAVSSYKAGNIQKRLEDLLEDVVVEEATPPAESAADPVLDDAGAAPTDAESELAPPAAGADTNEEATPPATQSGEGQ